MKNRFIGWAVLSVCGGWIISGLVATTSIGWVTVTALGMGIVLSPLVLCGKA
jgi:hypothetical protein